MTAHKIPTVHAYKVPSLPELLAYLATHKHVQYHAPLDVSPRSVRVASKVRTWKKSPGRFEVWLDPMSRDADRFTADEGHLDRFRIPVGDGALEFVEAHGYLLAIGAFGRVVRRVSNDTTPEYDKATWTHVRRGPLDRLRVWYESAERYTDMAQAQALGPMYAWEALRMREKQESITTGYRADIEVHDHAHLSAYSADRPFGYILRTNGSHLFIADHEGDIVGGNDHGFAYIASTFAPGSWGGDVMVFLWWDGRCFETLKSADLIVDRLREARSMSRDRREEKRA